MSETYDITCNRCSMYLFDGTPEETTAWMAEHTAAHWTIDAQKAPPVRLMAERFEKKRKKKEVTT